MNNKKYLAGISVLVVALIGIGAYWTYNYYFIACCAPPPEQIPYVSQNDEHVLTGNWNYFSQDKQGYSSGIDLSINQVDDTVAGEFNMVWSFPKAPAARLNNGTFHGKIVSGNANAARVEWIGSRDDSGTADIMYNSEKDAIEWRAVTSTVSDLTMPDKVFLYRNHWPEMSHDEQLKLAKVAESAFEQIPGMDGGEAFIEATIVVGDRAAVPFESVDGVSSGTLYLQKDGDSWKVIPDPDSGTITD